MKKTRVLLLALTLLTIAGCASDPLAPEDPAVEVMPPTLIDNLEMQERYAPGAKPNWPAACEMSPGHFSQKCRQMLVESIGMGVVNAAACIRSPWSAACLAASIANAGLIQRYENQPGEDGHSGWEEHWEAWQDEMERQRDHLRDDQQDGL